MPKTAASQAFQVRGRRLRLLPFNTSVSCCSTVPLAAAAASAALPAAYAYKTLHTHAFCDCLMLDSLLLGELWLYLSLSSPGPAYPQGKSKGCLIGSLEQNPMRHPRVHVNNLNFAKAAINSAANPGCPESG